MWHTDEQIVGGTVERCTKYARAIRKEGPCNITSWGKGTRSEGHRHSWVQAFMMEFSRHTSFYFCQLCVLFYNWPLRKLVKFWPSCSQLLNAPAHVSFGSSFQHAGQQRTFAAAAPPESLGFQPRFSFVALTNPFWCFFPTKLFFFRFKSSPNMFRFPSHFRGIASHCY